MADKKRRKKGQLPPGVKGPQPGPPRPPAPNSARSSSSQPASQPSNFQQASLPLLTKLLALPRWLIVVAMGAFLFLGLIQTGNLSWLGGIFLVIVGGFLAWLLGLSWPVLSVGRRATRLIVVIAVLGIAVLKFLGRF